VTDPRNIDKFDRRCMLSRHRAGISAKARNGTAELLEIITDEQGWPH
jgi:hypothetical protein